MRPASKRDLRGDGSAATLEQLLDGNHDRMGTTSQLSAHERDALLAYLRSL